MSHRQVDPVGALYAEVLGEVAWEQGGEALLVDVGDALSALGQAWAEERSLRAYFLSGRVPQEEKRDALARLLEPMPLLVRQFMRLLMRRGRGRIVDRVAIAFEEYMDRKLGRVQVTLTTATPIEEAQREAWIAQLRAATGKEPVLRTEVKPELVAGAILQVADTIADGSARRRLNELKARVRERGKHALQA
jgi:F-type H+-transporting ATPase subunit delta